MRNDRIKPLSGGVAKEFEAFQKFFCCCHKNREAASYLKLEVKESGGEYYIDGLAHAARQHSFARDVCGFKVSGNMSHERAARYFSLFKVQAAVAALEQYAKCFGQKKKWYDLTLSPGEDSFDHDAFRKVLKGASVKKIVRSLKDPLSERWKAYLDGRDAEIIGVAVALRNAFAHGEIWGADKIERYGGQISELILATLLRHVSSLIDDPGGS